MKQSHGRPLASRIGQVCPIYRGDPNKSNPNPTHFHFSHRPQNNNLLTRLLTCPMARRLTRSLPRRMTRPMARRLIRSVTRSVTRFLPRRMTRPPARDLVATHRRCKADPLQHHDGIKPVHVLALAVRRSQGNRIWHGSPSERAFAVKANHVPNWINGDRVERTRPGTGAMGAYAFAL